MLKEIEKIILESTDSQVIKSSELLQYLWKDYGSLSRIYLDTGSVILKCIDIPTSLKNSQTLSHQRKIKSYQVESNWYQYHNFKNSNFYSPRLIACGKIDSTQYIILEDLKASNYMPLDTCNWQQIQSCLSWLAYFHAKHIHQTPTNLWSTGTYWHLLTRPDELLALKDMELKSHAQAIDDRLNSSPYKTIVHGDAKLANFLFSKNLLEMRVAAVDFQYVGHGVGIKDVIYFLSSVYGEDELFNNEEKALDCYFKNLKDALSMTIHKNDIEKIELNYRELYPFAWCDFYRFLQGWSPGHWKINRYMDEMKKRAGLCS